MSEPNIMRHASRELSDHEHDTINLVKDQGLAFWMILNGMESSRELSLAKTKIEEAVMWAVKHITR